MPPRIGPRGRRWLIRAGVAGAVLFVLGLAAALAIYAYAPAISREGLEAALASALARPVHIEGVRLALWRGGLEVTNLRVDQAPDGKGEPMLRVGRGLVRVGISSLWRRELILSTILLEDVSLRLDNNGAAQNASAPPLDIPDTVAAGPVTARIGAVQVERGDVVYRDAARRVGVDAKDIHATMRPNRRGLDVDLRLAALSVDTADLHETATSLETSAWLHHENIVVKRLAFLWQGRPVRLSGEIRQPFAAADVDARAQGEADLAPLAKRLGAPWPMTGVATVDATVRGPLSALTIAGRLTIPRFTAGPVQAQDLAIRARWTPTEVDASEVTARIFGGTLRGALRTTSNRWDNTHATVVLRGVSLGSLEPLAPVLTGLKGDVDVEADADGDPRRPLEARGHFRIAGTRLILPGDVSRLGAGTLAAAGTFQQATAVLTNVSGRWPSLHVEGSGPVGIDGPQGLQFTVDGDLGTLTRLWGLSGFVGQAMLKGAAVGRWADPDVTGTVRVAPVTLAGVKLDTLHASLRLRGTTLGVDSAAATLGQSQATTSGTVDWSDARDAAGPGAWRHLRIRADVPAATLRWEDFHAWLPQAARGTGGVILAGHVEGTPEAWRGEGTIRASTLSVQDVPIRDLQSAFVVSHERLDVSDLRASADGAPVRAAGTWRWDGTGSAIADVGPVNLAEVRRIPPSLALQGSGQAHVSVMMKSGSFDVSGTAALERVAVADLALGPGSGRFAAQGGRVQASLAFPDRRLFADASGALDGATPVAIRLDARDVALAPVLAGLEPLRGLGVSGTLSAHADVFVPIAQPSAVRGTLTVNGARLLLAGEEWTNQGALILRWEPNVLTIDRFRLAGRLGELQVSGRLDPWGTVGLQVEGRVPLGILAAFRPEIREANGTLRVTGQIGGTVAAPRPVGEVMVQAGTFQLRDRPETLREVEARALLSPSGIRLVEATGSLGRGRIRASGDLALQGWRPGAYKIAISGTNVSLTPFQALQTAWDMDLELVGQGDRRLLRGEGRLVQGRYTGQLNLIGMLLSRRSEPAAETGVALPLRILLKLNNNLRVDTNWARMQAGGTLTLEGTTAEPVVLGSLVSQEGRITFRKQRWTVSSAAVRFANPRRIEPILDVTGRAQINDYDVTLHLAGRVDELTFQFSSVPALTQAELMSLVALGTTKTGGAGSAGGAILGEVAQLFAEDVLGMASGGYAPETIGVEKTDANGQVFNVGKQVTENMRVVYTQTLSGESRRTVRVEYQVIGPLLLSAQQDFQRGFGGDILVRLRFR